MSKVLAKILEAHYRTIIQTATHQLIADEPKGSGGEDLGFSPSELLSASLSACTSITLRMYADRKGYPLEGAEVEVVFEKVENTTILTRNIKLIGALTEEQKTRLLQIANQCYIHKTLTNPIQIMTNIL
jgi:putative redox protein